MSDPESHWPALPTETEIYILPNGEIVVADLPAELSATLEQLMQTRLDDQSVSDSTAAVEPPAQDAALE